MRFATVILSSALALVANRSHPDEKPSNAPASGQSVPAKPAGPVGAEERPAPDPTRYGDWEKNGRCIDF